MKNTSKEQLSLRNFGRKELEKIYTLIKTPLYEVHNAEPLSFVLDVVVNNKPVFVKDESQTEVGDLDVPWWVESPDGIVLDTFKTKKQAISFCKKLHLNWELYE